MPKHYCDYCDVFLTHDSASVRKAHNSGRNHLANVRDYYASLGHDKAQSIIDQITSAYESGQGPPPGGFGFRPSDLGAPAPAPAFPVGMAPPGFPARPPFPPGPGGMPPFPPGMMPPGGPPPFPPAGFPPGAAPPFPPNAPPGGAMPPFPPGGAPPPNLAGAGPGGPGAPSGPPLPPPTNQSGSDSPSSGPVVHPDRLRMMSG